MPPADFSRVRPRCSGGFDSAAAWQPRAEPIGHRRTRCLPPDEDGANGGVRPRVPHPHTRRRQTYDLHAHTCQDVAQSALCRSRPLPAPSGPSAAYRRSDEQVSPFVLCTPSPKSQERAYEGTHAQACIALTGDPPPDSFGQPRSRALGPASRTRRRRHRGAVPSVEEAPVVTGPFHGRFQGAPAVDRPPRSKRPTSRARPTDTPDETAHWARRTQRLSQGRRAGPSDDRCLRDVAFVALWPGPTAATRVKYGIGHNPG
jgi:hypothetical protein